MMIIIIMIATQGPGPMGSDVAWRQLGNDPRQQVQPMTTDATRDNKPTHDNKAIRANKAVHDNRRNR